MNPFIQGGLNLYRILRTDLVTGVLLCQSPNDDVYVETPLVRGYACFIPPHKFINYFDWWSK